MPRRDLNNLQWKCLDAYKAARTAYNYMRSIATKKKMDDAKSAWDTVK